MKNKYIDFKVVEAITGNVYQPRIEYVELVKENNSLKEELRLWVQMYYEIMKIFGKVIPINRQMIDNSIDKQNTLLVYCRDVIKSIDDPESLFQKYKNQLQNQIQNQLQSQLQEQLEKERIEKQKLKPKKKNDNPDLFLKNKPYVEQLQSSQLKNRLNDVDKILSKEIAKNKRYIPKSITNQPTNIKKRRFSPSPKKNKFQFLQDEGIISLSNNEKAKKNEPQTKFDNKNSKNENENHIENQNTHGKSPSTFQKTVRKRKNKKSDEN